MTDTTNLPSNGQFSNEDHNKPEEQLWFEGEIFETETDRRGRAEAFREITSEGKHNVAMERIRITEPQTDWQMKRWMYYGLIGFGVFLNLGLSFTLTVVLPHWMQIIVVAPISIAISLITEHSIGLTTAKITVNNNLKPRIERLTKSEQRNILGREVALCLAEFQEDREYQTILPYEYIGFFLPLGEVLAIAFCMVLFRPSDNQLGQFLGTVLLVSPIGVLPILIGMIFCYFEYTPMIRWHIVRSYKRYLGEDDGGALRGQQDHSPTPEPPEEQNRRNKESATDPKGRRIHLN